MIGLYRKACGLLLAVSIGACSTPVDGEPIRSVTIEPAEAEVAAGGTRSFTAAVEGTGSREVTWAASGGTFVETASGIDWTAPAQPGEYTLTARSVADPSRTGNALVRVLASDPFFSAYRGTAATLPAGMFVAGEDGSGRQVEDGYDPFTGVSNLLADPPDAFEGFGAFTADGVTHSFGIRERGDVDLREARLFFRFVNTGDRPVAGFTVEYDVEVWRLGARANQIRMKLNTAMSGYSALPDIAATPNPRGAAVNDSIGMVVDGTRPENRTRVAVTIDLAELPGPNDATFGSLAPGDTAYFRWQYSNVDGDDGNVRSSLGIRNLQIVPVHGDGPVPPTALGPLVFSHEAGFHSAPFELELKSSLAGATIFYTVDGSAPDPAHVMSDEAWHALPRETRQRTFMYDRPIDVGALASRPNDISLIPTNESGLQGYPRWTPPEGEVKKAAVVRALVTDAAGARTHETRTYFVAPEGRRRYSLPVVSLVTNRSNLFASDKGIYVAGTTGENFMRRGAEWERPAHMELFDLDGSRPLAQEIGIRIHGGSTRSHPQKSLRLYARSEYGPGRFRHRFFTSKQVDDFNRILLRNSGNDWAFGVMRDVTIQTLVQHLSFGTQHYQPVIVFINGEYWGLHDLRDRFDHHHLETHYGVPRDQVTILENHGMSVVAGQPGDELPYQDFLTRVRGGELQTRAAFDVHMDVDGFLEYAITQLYAGNSDWPHHNITWWRYSGPQPTHEAGPRDGRWRWFLFDADRSFGFFTTAETNMLEYMFEPGPSWAWSVELFLGLMDVREIREEFLQRIAVHLATTFEAARVRSHIEAIAAEIEPEMPERIARWRSPSSVWEWTHHKGVMLDFAARRPAIFRQQVVDYFPEIRGTAEIEVADLSGGSGVSVHTVALEAGTPGVALSGGRWRGELFTGVPVVIRSAGVDLTRAQVSGMYDELVLTSAEIRFVPTGAVRVTLP